jgi:hypothetical protein
MDKPASSMMIVLAASLALPGAATACVSAPFVETWTNSGNVAWIEAPDGTCSFDASVTAATPSAATVHYRRAVPERPLRLSFVVDPHLTSLSAAQQATLATAVAGKVPAAGPANAALFEVQLRGNAAGNSPRIAIGGACNNAGAVNGECQATTTASFADFPMRITVEIAIGAGTEGWIHAWLGPDSSGPPTLALDNLDNERWRGIDRVGIGLSNVSTELFSMIGTQHFTFSDVSVSDPELFWNGFDSDLIGNVATNGVDLVVIPAVIPGSTCGGSLELPWIASGSTRLIGAPTAIHALTTPSGNQRFVHMTSNVTGMVVFACPAGSGPSGPCIQGVPDQGVVNMGPGDYQIVIGNLFGQCGAYQLDVGGTLGDVDP